MAKHSMPEMKEGGVNVTPLIDVVMCLIIFFMLVAKIGVSTGATPMALPTTIMGKKIEELKMVDPITGYRPLLATLKNFRFGKDLKQGGAKENADNPEFKVIIRGEESMGYQYLEPVLITCAEARVKNVNFNTKRAMQ